jgi:ferritin heavy chain
VVRTTIVFDFRKIMADVLLHCSGDSAVEDAIQAHFLRKETRHVKDMGDLLQQCVRVSKQAGHGLYHLDKELRENGGVVPWGEANDPDTITEELYKVKV